MQRLTQLTPLTDTSGESTLTTDTRCFYRTRAKMSLGKRFHKVYSVANMTKWNIIAAHDNNIEHCIDVVY